jgi:hypothetical protein
LSRFSVDPACQIQNRRQRLLLYREVFLLEIAFGNDIENVPSIALADRSGCVQSVLVLVVALTHCIK